MAKRKVEQQPEKPVKKPSKTVPERQFSLCIPSTIISSTNAKNLQQITYIAYQVAKAATIYNIPEIVILNIPSIHKRQEMEEKANNKVVVLDKKIKFNETEDEKQSESHNNNNNNNDDNQSDENNCELFATLLQYFVTPPYLVKSIFPQKYLKKFKYAQALPTISTLPFMNNNDVIKHFKEGITVAKQSPGKSKNKNKLRVSKYVNIGDDQMLELSHEVPVNVRVTVDIKNKKVVSPLTAYGTSGTKSSFGYYTRIASEFSEIVTKASVPLGYTSTILVECDDYFSNTTSGGANTLTFNKDNNKVLLVFGNIHDLTYSLNQDSSLDFPIDEFFDYKLGGIKNVNIQEKVLMSLTQLYIQ